METLETKRLLLRSFASSDAPIVQQLAGDVEIARTTLSIPYPYPDGAAEEWIAFTISAREQGKGYTYAVINKENNILLGCISLEGIHKDHQRAELGYWLGKPYWNQGYTTEAAKEIIRFGFEELGLHRIYAYAMTQNPGSTRVMEKAGLKFEGVLKGHIIKWGEFQDLAAYGLVKEEYQPDLATE